MKRIVALFLFSMVFSGAWAQLPNPEGHQLIGCDLGTTILFGEGSSVVAAQNTIACASLELERKRHIAFNFRWDSNPDIISNKTYRSVAYGISTFIDELGNEKTLVDSSEPGEEVNGLKFKKSSTGVDIFKVANFESLAQAQRAFIPCKSITVLDGRGGAAVVDLEGNYIIEVCKIRDNRLVAFYYTNQDMKFPFPIEKNTFLTADGGFKFGCRFAFLGNDGQLFIKKDQEKMEKIGNFPLFRKYVLGEIKEKSEGVKGEIEGMKKKISEFNNPKKQSSY
ncbi:MAG: hypothetical protein HQM08_21190 [Candidatus Riflebacteria bacterium]|nr:hypothetical protein [Candidatus Riflebacteria bacterium]